MNNKGRIVVFISMITAVMLVLDVYKRQILGIWLLGAVVVDLRTYKIPNRFCL